MSFSSPIPWFSVGLPFPGCVKGQGTLENRKALEGNRSVLEVTALCPEADGSRRMFPCYPVGRGSRCESLSEQEPGFPVI